MTFEEMLPYLKNKRMARRPGKHPVFIESSRKYRQLKHSIKTGSSCASCWTYRISGEDLLATDWEIMGNIKDEKDELN